MALNLDAVGRRVGPFQHAYGWKDVALYALALGAGPAELHDLDVLAGHPADGAEVVDRDGGGVGQACGGA